ncbi:uncharacterized protein LOC130803502 [Amaranthus tricolor]|uniref:uncharacterized protein LOC130803502 n=1 Tax=Amaranthus tricolor TaxID=29722 RepID=UPI0025908CBA|nr:uncharacterized protein LOC130803502 [Amaranthus tricolor]
MESKDTIIMPDQPVTMGQLLQLFSQLNTNKPPPPPSETSTSTTTISIPTFSISEKLTHQNYTMWSRLMQLALSGRDRLNHIIADPPPQTDQEYSQWTRRDSVVISWIIESIHPDLVNQFIDFPIAKTLWKGIETVYSSGGDGLQIFDLTVKANKIEQRTDTLEKYYSNLITLWKEIDRRQPNPMKDPEDKVIYNQLTQKNRLYQFLAGVNETFDKERRDLLLQDPLPTAEEAYAFIRREIMRRGIMKKEPSSEVDSSGSGGVFAVRGRSKKSYRKNDDRSHLQCTHCGGMRHTKSECFKLVGYPDWWPDTRKKGAKMAGQLSDQPRSGRAAVVSSTKSDENMAAMVKYSKEDEGNREKQKSEKMGRRK